jgi:hypothetical protein
MEVPRVDGFLRRNKMLNVGNLWGRWVGGHAFHFSMEANDEVASPSVFREPDRDLHREGSVFFRK